MAIFTFEPIYQARPWGGDRLTRSFHRSVPQELLPVGESWELVDRAEATSRLTTAWEGCADLHELWAKKRAAVFGKRTPAVERFPLMVKLLDVAESENLSVQVHPGPQQAAARGGESKRELWYFLECATNAKFYAGWRRGVKREEMEKHFGASTMPLLLHSIPAERGEAFYNPPGRVHALGGGNLVLEVQESAETTYRIYDWDRMGTDGKPRTLHLEEARACVNWNDAAPGWTQPHGERLLDCGAFAVERSFIFPDEGRQWSAEGASFHYHFIGDGSVTFEGQNFPAGSSFLVTADHPVYELTPAADGAEVITTQWGRWL